MKTLHAREMRNHDAPQRAWFSGHARRIVASLIKNGYITDGDGGVRLTNRGRQLIGVAIKADG